MATATDTNELSTKLETDAMNSLKVSALIDELKI